jgi:hypothetical protein
MALLFDNDDPDASQGFKNLKAAADDSTGRKIRLALEELWSRFEPYADKQFIKEFGRHVEERFWEMYLGVRLLEGRKALRKKDKLPKAERIVDFVDEDKLILADQQERRNQEGHLTDSQQGIVSDLDASRKKKGPTELG